MQYVNSFMQFHMYLYLLNHLSRRKMGIGESLNTIRADLTTLDQGRTINQNVGGVLNVTIDGSQASKCHKPELSIFIRSQDMLV